MARNDDFQFPASFGFSGSAKPAAAKCGGGTVRAAAGGAIRVRKGPERPMDSDVPVPPSKLGKPRGITGPLADIDEIHRGPGNRTTVRRGKNTEIFGNLDDAMHPDKAAGPTTRYTRGTDGSTTAEYAKGGMVRKVSGGKSVPSVKDAALQRTINRPTQGLAKGGDVAGKKKWTHIDRYGNHLDDKGTVTEPDDLDYGAQPGQAAMSNIAANGEAAVKDPKYGSISRRNAALRDYHDAWGNDPDLPPILPTPNPMRKAKGGFLKSAIKKPGRIKAMAAREGVSTLQAAQKASHSSDPSLRAAGNLGKRFIKGDLSSKKRKG